jgi:hypothetical protein
MIEQEQHKIKSKLIEFGFWGADEPGDPTTDKHDAGTHCDCLQAKLAKDVFLVSEIVSDYSLAREVVIFHADQTYKLVIAPHYIQVISLTAFAKPEFLRLFPRRTADQK